MTIEPFWVQVSGLTLMQGDYLPGCIVPVPIFDPTNFSKDDQPQNVQIEIKEFDLVILTQSCDLENKKATSVVLSRIHTLLEFEETNPQFIQKGKWNDVLRGRVEGLHLLASPTEPDNNRKALVVDFREIYSLPYEYLVKHAAGMENRWRLKSPFLEHFTQAFARLFMRVGLPSTIPSFK